MLHSEKGEGDITTYSSRNNDRGRARRRYDHTSVFYTYDHCIYTCTACSFPVRSRQADVGAPSKIKPSKISMLKTSLHGEVQ